MSSSLDETKQSPKQYRRANANLGQWKNILAILCITCRFSIIICAISLFVLLLHFCCFVQHKDYPIPLAPDSELGAAEHLSLMVTNHNTHMHTYTHTDNFLCLAALACSIWSSTSTMTSHIYTLHRTSPFPVKNKHSDQSPRIPTHCTQLLFSISVWLHSPCSHSHIVDNCMHSHTHDGEPLPLSLPDLACSILPCTFSDHSPHTHWLMLHSSLSPVSGWLQLEQTWTETSHAHSHTNYPELPDLACSVLPRIHSDHRHAASIHIALSPVTGWFYLAQTWTGTSHMHSHTHYVELLPLSLAALFTAFCPVHVTVAGFMHKHELWPAACTPAETT